MLGRTRLINDVNGFVRQMPVVDVFRAQLGRSLKRCNGVLDTVVRLKTRLQAFETFHRFLNRRLGHIDFLEAP